MKLSILICHLPDRYAFLKRLNEILAPQKTPDVEILVDTNPMDNIGTKRNRLMERAQGKYIAFIDDDDTVNKYYIPLLMRGINEEADCCSLTGIYTEDGKYPKVFNHSIRYNGWYEKDNIYYRYVNHLNCIRSSIAKQFRFPEKNHGEDHDFSKQLQRSGLLKTEHQIDEILYFYDHRTK